MAAAFVKRNVTAVQHVGCAHRDGCAPLHADAQSGVDIGSAVSYLVATRGVVGMAGDRVVFLARHMCCGCARCHLGHCIRSVGRFTVGWGQKQVRRRSDELCLLPWLWLNHCEVVGG